MSITTRTTAGRRGPALPILALGAALLLAAGAACGSEPDAPTATSPAAATATAAPTATAASNGMPADAPPVGADAGNSLPHFDMTLADGSTVSTEALADEGKPAFLYFFSTW